MNKKVEKSLAVVFSGIGGIVLTLLFQYLLFPQTQSITIVLNGIEYSLTEEDCRAMLDANEHFQALNEVFQAEIATLQAENSNLQEEVNKLRQANSTMDNSAENVSTGNSSFGSSNAGNSSAENSSFGSSKAGNSSTENSSFGSSNAGNNSADNSSIGSSSAGNSNAGNGSTWNGNAENNSNNINGVVWLRNNENVSGCPQVNIPKESQIANQSTYEMTWTPFENATIYHISMWKDANYGTADSNIIFVDEVEISGLSYTIDLTVLEPGYTYGYNVVVDNHFSSPLLIELY